MSGKKTFFWLSSVTKLLKDFIPRLYHNSDGLKFQPYDDPYVCSSNLFKLSTEDDRQMVLQGHYSVIFTHGDPRFYSGKIIECPTSEPTTSTAAYYKDHHHHAYGNVRG